MISKFKQFWFEFNKAKLTGEELIDLRSELRHMNRSGYADSYKLKQLMNAEPKKLNEEWKAERVMMTEEKRLETNRLKRIAMKHDYTKFRIAPSYKACKTCLKFSNNGKKVFTADMLKVDGRNTPPIHPNCTCILDPIK